LENIMTTEKNPDEKPGNNQTGPDAAPPAPEVTAPAPVQAAPATAAPAAPVQAAPATAAPAAPAAPVQAAPQAAAPTEKSNNALFAVIGLLIAAAISGGFYWHKVTIADAIAEATATKVDPATSPATVASFDNNPTTVGVRIAPTDMPGGEFWYSGKKFLVDGERFQQLAGNQRKLDDKIGETVAKLTALLQFRKVTVEQDAGQASFKPVRELEQLLNQAIKLARDGVHSSDGVGAAYDQGHKAVVEVTVKFDESTRTYTVTDASGKVLEVKTAYVQYAGSHDRTVRFALKQAVNYNPNSAALWGVYAVDLNQMSLVGVNEWQGNLSLQGDHDLTTAQADARINKMLGRR
jgi:hypothetical protein